jgi:pyridoxal phosphate enzyme (YggS family)
MSVIPKNLQAVRSRIDRALQIAHRLEHAVRLVAVSKTFAAASLLEAYDQGQRDFGENYLQEALPKMAIVNDALAARGAELPVWHMIGPLQSNKTRLVAEHFDWVHSVERIKIAERLSAQRPAAKGRLKVLLQINISREATKSGALPEEAQALAEAVARLPALELRGLMAIPAEDDEGAFRRLAELAASLACDIGPDLSMGMSGDLEAAIAAGATIVRVGTAIFGARPAAAVLPVDQIHETPDSPGEGPS